MLGLAGCEPAPTPGFEHVVEKAQSAPEPPAWAAELIGKPLRSRFIRNGDCLGTTDGMTIRYAGERRGARVVGWAWEPAAHQPVQRVLVIDPDYISVGAGETGLPRQDVPAARPDITSDTTGWWAVTALPRGGLDVVGVLADGQSVCKLGGLPL